MSWPSLNPDDLDPADFDVPLHPMAKAAADVDRLRGQVRHLRQLMWAMHISYSLMILGLLAVWVWTL